jgi:hypothetical protein
VDGLEGRAPPIYVARPPLLEWSCVWKHKRSLTAAVLVGLWLSPRAGECSLIHRSIFALAEEAATVVVADVERSPATVEAQLSFRTVRTLRGAAPGTFDVPDCLDCPSFELGQQWLLFLDASDGVFNVDLLLRESPGAAIAPEAEAQLEAIEGWLRASDDAARRALLVELSVSRRDPLGLDAAIHLADSPGLLRSMTDVEERRLIDALPAARGPHTLYLALTLARRQALEALPDLIRRLEVGNGSLLFPIAMLANHVPPSSLEASALGRHYRDWLGAHAGLSPDEVLRAGLVERSVTARYLDDRSALAAAIRGSTDELTPVVLFSRCELLVGRHLERSEWYGSASIVASRALLAEACAGP